MYGFFSETTLIGEKLCKIGSNIASSFVMLIGTSIGGDVVAIVKALIEGFVNVVL